MNSDPQSLKIAIIHLSFIYSGGGEKLVIEEAKLLERRGHKVVIYTPIADKDKSFPDQIRSVEIREFIPSVLRVVKEHGSFYVLINCVLAPILAFRLRKYDVILAANQPSLWFAYFAKKMFGVPYVSYLAQPTRFLYPRDIDSETGLHFSNHTKIAISTNMMKLFRRFIDFADKVSIHNSSYVLVNGEHVRSQIDKVYKIKSISCPAGAYFDKTIHPRSKKMEKPYLLVTNRHFPQKRFEYAITAFANLKSEFPKLKLVITGEPTDYTLEIKSLIERLNLSDVYFVGYVNSSKLRKLYREALIYLYTAPEEDFGMGIIEAMGYGTPVVAWDNAGPSQIIKSGENGFLAKTYNLADFNNKLQTLIVNKKLYEKISHSARKTIEDIYGYDKHIEMLENYLVMAV